MIRTKHIKTVILVFFALIVVQSCEDSETFEPAPVPQNPFDTITPPSPPVTTPIDSSTFLGLHEYIFSTTCAVPGCHDGHFEPDFRSVQSSYNTMVYHVVEACNRTTAISSTSSTDLISAPQHSASFLEY